VCARLAVTFDGIKCSNTCVYLHPGPSRRENVDNCCAGVYLQAFSNLLARRMLISHATSHGVEMYTRSSAYLEQSRIVGCTGGAVFAFQCGECWLHYGGAIFVFECGERQALAQKGQVMRSMACQHVSAAPGLGLNLSMAIKSKMITLRFACWCARNCPPLQIPRIQS